MRDIKFRAKRIDNNEWVYGSLFVDDCYGGETECYIEYINYETLPYKKSVKVKPETVGQYIGLKDKNGKEIYEGDIVHCWDTIAKCEIWAVVEFGNPNAEYTWGWQLRKIKGSKGVNPDILCWVECEETNAYCEIIGNIYDNPELLKGE